MNHDPYTPPTADVTDVQIANPTPPRPVRWACWLVLTSLALSLLTVNPSAEGSGGKTSFGTYLVFAAVGFLVFGGLTVWFTVAVWRRRRWSRWALLIYLLIGWALSLSTLAEDLNQVPFTALVSVVSIIIELAACALLFFGDGARWFAAGALHAEPYETPTGVSPPPPESMPDAK